jgi:hypothetical protein
MKIAFTGSRQGMTPEQKITFSRLLYEVGAQLLIHGDCIGADADAHGLAMEAGAEVWKRPCNIETQRAFSEGGEIVAKPEDPLSRNKKIVDDGEQLIACPASFQEELRSGTWSTIRYAKRNNCMITIIWPDGRTDLTATGSPNTVATAR